MTESVDWHLLQWAPHEGVRKWVKDLNAFYKAEPAMHELDNQVGGSSGGTAAVMPARGARVARA